MPNGNGKVYREDGTLEFEGEFSRGALNGIAKHYRTDGTAFYGGWKDDTPHGNGKEYRDDGTIEFEGKFKNGRRDGNGKVYREDGTLAYEGEWVKNILHMGKKYRPDGTLEYEGPFRNGRMDKAAKRKAEHLAKERDKVAKMHRTSKHMEDVPQCAVCTGDMHHGDVSFAYAPCGHRALCGSCEKTLAPEFRSKCMVCRGSATLMRLYG